MAERGWLLDVFDCPERGVVLWLLCEDGPRVGCTRRVRLEHAFPVTFYAAGPAPRLRQLWRYLESVGGRGWRGGAPAAGMDGHPADPDVGANPCVRPDAPPIPGYDPAPILLSRQERRDLFQEKPIPVLACQVQRPARLPSLFRQVAQAFPELIYYDADVQLALRYAAAYGVFPLARCEWEAVNVPPGMMNEESRNPGTENTSSCLPGFLIENGLRPLDTPWDLDPPPAPYTALSIDPDTNPFHTPPTCLLIRWMPAEITRHGAIPERQPVTYRLPLQAERPLLVNLRAILLRHDPDLLLTTYGDTWLIPLLLRLCRKWRVDLPLNREPGRGLLYKRERSYFTYGKIIHRGQQYHLYGRWHIDRCNAMLFHDYGMHGVIELGRVTGLPLQTVARVSPGTGISSMQIITALRLGVMVPWHKQQAEFPKNILEMLRADQGGMVYQPTVGLHHHVAEVDFISMYPSIMSRFNISPEVVKRPPASEPGMESSLESTTLVVEAPPEPIQKQASGLQTGMESAPESRRLAVEAVNGSLSTDYGNGLNGLGEGGSEPAEAAKPSPFGRGQGEGGHLLMGRGQRDGIQGTFRPLLSSSSASPQFPSLAFGGGREGASSPHSPPLALGGGGEGAGQGPGLIPQTLEPLLQKRLALKIRLAELPVWRPERMAYTARSSAHKWLLVTCFGYLGYKNARFGRIEAHEAVTAYGRECLLRAKEAAEELDCEVLHLYVDGMWTKKEGLRQPKDFQPLLDRIAESTGLPIALDGVFRWVAFLPSRVDDRVPVPNRYFGVFQDGSIKVRGIEARREDTPPFIVRMQMEMLERMARHPDGPDGICHLEEVVPDLLAILRGKLRDLRRFAQAPAVSRWAGLVQKPLRLDDLVVSLKLSRELEEYRTPSAAARAAAQLRRVGKILRPGQRVKFLYTLGEEGVRAWDLPGAPDPRTVDVARYRVLILRAASTILQPFGQEAILRALAGTVPPVSENQVTNFPPHPVLSPPGRGILPPLPALSSAQDQPPRTVVGAGSSHLPVYASVEELLERLVLPEELRGVQESVLGWRVVQRAPLVAGI